MAGEMDNFSSFTFNRSLKPANKSNVLECRVCEDVFGLQGDKVPRLLYCGHTVCHACLLRLPLREETILCPFDRQPTPVGNSGVWGLKKNFALLELLERLQLTAPMEKAMTPAERQRQPAAGCDEDGSHPASIYCTVCLTQLCEPCSELTHGTRTLSKHRRVPLSEKPRERPRCATHQSQVAEFTCLEEQCQALPPAALLMCFICKDYGRHKSHKLALVEMEAESIRASVVDTVQHMRKFMEDMSETVHKLELAVQRLEGGDGTEGTADGARLRVAQHFAAQREALARQETAARTTVDTHVRDRVCSLRQLQEDLATSVSQVASVCVQCEQSALLDDARLLATGREIREALDFVDKQQQQFAQLGADELLPDAAIPITFTKDHRVHIGPHVVMRVLTLGLDGAGKTSILFKLKNDEFITAVPTIGFNVETVEHNDLVFTVWDVGGQPKLRPLWRHYYFNTQAVVFVIDSADRDRLDEALCELAKLLSEKELKDASLLILANKQDVEGCASIEELAQTMSLSKLCAGRSWHVQACDAQSGTGLRDGLDWLSRQIVLS